MFDTKKPYNLGIQPRFQPYDVFTLQKLYESGFSRTSGNAEHDVESWFSTLPGFEVYFHISTFDFKNLYRKKSRMNRSGEWDGQTVCTFLKIKQPSNIHHKQIIVSHTEWHVTLSCWNRICGNLLFLVSSSCTDSFNSCLWYSRLIMPSKQIRPYNTPHYNFHPNCYFKRVKGLFVNNLSSFVTPVSKILFVDISI